LDSKIATTSEWSTLGKFVFRPEPKFLTYTPLRPPFETKLYQQLWARYCDLKEFRPLFIASKEISSHLGRWCSDMFWSSAFSEAKARKAEARLEIQSQRSKDRETDKVDQQIARLDQAHQEIAGYAFGVPSASLDDISSKVIKLLELLQAYFTAKPCGRCLVFVERRATALLMHHVMSHVGGSLIKTGILVGTTRSDLAGMNYSIKEQVMTLLSFRKGDLNCLVSLQYPFLTGALFQC